MEANLMDINKYVSLAIGIAVIAIVVGVMGPVVATNLLPTSGEGIAILDNAGTINTILQLLMLFVPIVALLAIVKGAMSKN